MLVGLDNTTGEGHRRGPCKVYRYLTVLRAHALKRAVKREMRCNSDDGRDAEWDECSGVFPAQTTKAPG